jgi:signal transduction histidine kinase
MMPDASREVTAIPFLAALGIAYNALGLGDTASSHQAPQNDLPEMNTNQVSAIISSPLSVAPPYATVVAEIAGKPLVGVKKTGTPANLDISGGILARATIGDAAVTAYLTNPALLYGAQRRRTLWFTAIILISALAATAALIALHRNFLQQVRLGEMKTNFVSSVSHELRAPIASMRLLAEGLDRGKISDPPRQQEYYKLLAQESRRLSTLIENILDYSRIDSGRKTYEKEPADLPALVQQTIALMTPAAADRRVSLIAPAPNALADTSVVCDGLAIQQALINLLDNAIKHSPPDSAVTIGLERLNGDVSLSVQDSGPGIPLDEREKILERFYRRGTELRRETQGIGIGLTIVKHIIEGHHGRVLVAGDMGQGSRFTLQWPANGGPDPA